MKGHNLMQAIARVNRVFRDKPGGLIVDFIGIGHLLKEAARKYTKSGFEEPTEELDEAAKAEFFRALVTIREFVPEKMTVANRRSLSNIEIEDLFSMFYGRLIETGEKRDDFLVAEKKLSSALSLVRLPSKWCCENEASKPSGSSSS